jgi:hypothetical protein
MVTDASVPGSESRSLDFELQQSLLQLDHELEIEQNSYRISIGRRSPGRLPDGSAWVLFAFTIVLVGSLIFFKYEAWQMGKLGADRVDEILLEIVNAITLISLTTYYMIKLIKYTAARKDYQRRRSEVFAQFGRSIHCQV